MVDAARHSGSGKLLHCVIVTPEATVFDGEAEFVAVPLFDGEIGIAPSHSPLIGRLGYGELRIRRAGSTDHYYIDGGFVQVADNLVSVLTSRAIPADQLDAEVVAEHLQAARTRKAHSPELLDQRDRAILQARAQLRLARRKKPLF
jgi:F-type H+-transporting ATPase subunit epsilon